MIEIMLQRIIERHERPISDRLMMWRMFNAKHSITTEDFYGKKICISGVRFEGSPRDVFWGGYIEPFLKDAIEKSFADLGSLCREKHLDATEFVEEMRALLEAMIKRTYEKMARTDQALRGNGNPNSVAIIRVETRIAAMNEFLARYGKAVAYNGRPADKAELLELKPRIWGLGIDLKVLWSRMKRFLPRSFGLR